MPVSRLLRVRAAALTSLVLFFGCGGTDGGPTDPPEVTVASVVVSPTMVSLASLGEEVQLEATVKASDGSVLTGESVSWTSSASGVATVSAAGLVKAVAEGTATVTAAVAGVESAPVAASVDQVATTVTASVDRDTLALGDTLTVTGEARDALGVDLLAPGFSWTSSDTGVADIDDQGVVTARSPGVAVITVRADDASGTVDLTVVVPNLKPAADTTLSGTVTVGVLEVPEGVTLNVDGDLTLVVQGDAVVAGTVHGACAVLAIQAAGALTLHGAVDNTCPSDPTAGMGLTLAAAGGYTIDEASITSSGPITLGPPAAQATPGNPRAPGRPDLAPAPSDAPPCTITRSSVGAKGRGKNGADGVSGGDGEEGAAVSIACRGLLSVSGVTVEGGAGGNGGKGTGDAATGGTGGEGGYAFFSAPAVRIFPEHGPTTVRGGVGGRGGDAEAKGVVGSDVAGAAVAYAGRGGTGGLAGLHLSGSSATATVEPTTGGGATLVISPGFGGDGGRAIAVGVDGRDATATVSAGPGGASWAVGGGGGKSGYLLSPFNRDVGEVTLEEFTPEGMANIQLSGGISGSGGEAVSSPGIGGAGSRERPHGGAGGSAHAEGGDGGLLHTRTGALVGRTGNGGDAVFMHGIGGVPWSDCVVAELGTGGRGGAGGSADGHAGDAGSPFPSEAAVNKGTHGAVVFSSVGNGASGGNGSPVGFGGQRGTNNVTTTGATVETTGDNFTTGADGTGCGGTKEAVVTVESDPAGHETFIGLLAIQSLLVEITSPNGLGITGAFPWVDLAGQFDPVTGTFTANGSGSVAGHPSTPEFFEGTFGTDGSGRLRWLEGSLVIGEGTLPTGQDVTYKVIIGEKPSGGGAPMR